MMRIYLAGPMSGYRRFNFDSFIESAETLRANGHDVFSPAEAALGEGFDPDNPGSITPERYEDWMKRDFGMIDDCEAVCFLPGWMDSKGAMREWDYAKQRGKRLLSFAVGEAEGWWR
jgi:nucleoside 2-deoxyribosyltransferase